jgi:mRNA interferase MazF
LKHFDSWNKKKKDIDDKSKLIGLKERDIVFIHMGVNVGYEQDGKGDEFLRPVVVVKVFNRNLFFWSTINFQKERGKFFCKDKL